jgi:hypothetical protein
MNEIEFAEFPKMARLSRDVVITEKARDGCGSGFVPHPKAIKQRFCSAACRCKTWAENNRARLNEVVRRYRARRYAANGAWREGGKAGAMKLWIAELKSAPCTDCGGRFPTCCMDFDHRRGEVKANNVGSMVAHHYARELIEAEIAKCDLVCANCHRVRTRDRRTGSGKYAQ